MSIRVPIGGKNVRLGPEQNTTPVAGGNDTVLNTTNRYYTYFTLPTSAALYVITGLEWKNGTVVNGGVMCQVETVNANPPTTGVSTLVAWGGQISQSGTSAVQRQSQVTSWVIPGGTLLGASVVSNSATGRFGTTTVASANNLRALALTAAPAIGSTTAWSAGTEEPYIKVYYKAVL